MTLRNPRNHRRPVAVIDREPRSGFLALDIECIERNARVHRVTYPGRVTVGYVARCAAAAVRCRALYVFFASEHALAPALLFRLAGRRVVLVQGGYDYANVPERSYGLAARGHGWLPRLIGRLCTVSLAISDQSRWEFLALVPSAAPRTRLSYLAVDADQWPDPLVDRDPDQVVTFGYIDDEAWSRKGVDRFVAAAGADPTRTYVLAGRLTPEVAARVDAVRTPNLRTTGHLDHAALRELLWTSSVYAQLSWHETFGVAMAEAMLCGCLPVIGDSPALAEVAGRWAVRAGAVPPGVTPAARRAAGVDDAKTIARALDRAATVDRAAIRADVATRFHPDARAADLAAALDGDATDATGTPDATGDRPGTGR